jgi:hypothetical protein
MQKASSTLLIFRHEQLHFLETNTASYSSKEQKLRYHKRGQQSHNKIIQKTFPFCFLLQPVTVGQDTATFDVHQMRQVSALVRSVDPGELVYVHVSQHPTTGQWLGSLGVVIASQLGPQHDRLYVLVYNDQLVAEFPGTEVWVDEKRPGHPRSGVNVPFGAAKPRGGGGGFRPGRGGAARLKFHRGGKRGRA